MDKSKLKVGDILKVLQNDEIHYEKVIQVVPTILTVDLNPDKDGEVSTQGLADNLSYEIIPDYRIAEILHTYLPRGIAFSIADRFYGSDYPMAWSTFVNAIKDLNYRGV